MSAEVDVYEEPEAPALPAPTLPVPPMNDFDSWTAVVGQVVRLAREIAGTPFVPDGLRGSAPAVAAAILSGRELGLPPMTALQHTHVIKGKVGHSALLMRALIISEGHEWVDVDVSDVRAVVKGRRKGETAWAEASFTAAQAKTAGIALGGYPQDKLYARATVRLARRKFADVILGMPYTAEELEDGEVPDEGGAGQPAAIEPPKPAAARTAQRRQPAPKNPAAAVPDGKPASGPAAAAGPAKPAAASPAPDLPPLPGEDEPNDSDTAVQAVTDLFDELAAHADHQLKQVGRCVYCVPCNARLYQGRLPSAKDREELREYARKREAESAEPGSAPAPGDERHRKLVGACHAHFKRLGFTDEDKADRLWAAGKIAGVSDLASLSDLDPDELSTLADTLAKCRDRKRLEEILAAAGQHGGEAT